MAVRSVGGLLCGRVASRAVWGGGAGVRGKIITEIHGVTRSAGYKSCLLRVTPRIPWLIIIFVTTHIIMFGRVASKPACRGVAVRGLLRKRVASRACSGARSVGGLLRGRIAGRRTVAWARSVEGRLGRERGGKITTEGTE
jgi:hypothetical protein